MTSEYEYTGASFELARPDPDKAEKLIASGRVSTASNPIASGGEFELAKPLPQVKGSSKPEKSPAIGGASPRSKEVEPSAAQKFLLARPGEGAVASSPSTPKKGGWEH